MFTPPPSPLPPAFSKKLHPQVIDDDQDSDMEEGVLVSPAPRQIPKLSLPPAGQKKTSRRRIWIPLLAVALVFAASASVWRRSPPGSMRFMPFSKPTSLLLPASHLLGSHSHTPWRTIALKHHHSLKRQVTNGQVSTGEGLPPPSAVTVGSSGTDTAPLPSASTGPTAAANRVSPAISDPPLPVPTPFPQPFDTSFSYNFSTSSCQSFFAQTLLSNITFRECRPLSLLLPASSAFFQAQSNLMTLTSVVGGTCNTVSSEDACGATMSWLAEEIVKPTVCGKDLEAGNALAYEALHGFQNYAFMRQAGCLVNQNTNSYCFVDAVASASAADYYFYSLPIGNPVPNNTVPSCSICTESVLAIYATQASNSTLLISKTYPAAADLAINKCGDKYAIQVDAVNGASSLLAGSPVWVVGFSILVGVTMASLEM